MLQRLLITSVILYILTGSLKAQTPNHYEFIEITGTYKELVNDTLLTPANFGTGSAWMLPHNGETFSFFNKQYLIDDQKKLISFSNSGHLRVDDDSTHIIIDAMFTYLDSIDNNSAISYIVEGTSGNRVIKIQWKNLSIRSGAPDNYVNFQVWLHQKTGIFEAYYGPSSISNKSGFTTKGANVGLFYSKKDFTKMYEKIWVNGLPGSYTLDSTRIASFKVVQGIPQDGTIFRYVPRSSPTGIKKHRLGRITVYPNPASDYVIIKLGKPYKAGVNAFLYDITGKAAKVNSKSFEKEIKLSLEGIPNGIYELVLEAEGIKEIHSLEIRH